MASLEDKLVDAFKKTAGIEGENTNIEGLGKDIAIAVEEFLMEQELRVVKLTSKIDVNKISLTKDQPVDVAPDTLMGPYAPLISSLKQLASLIPGAGSIIDKVQGLIKTAARKVSAGGATTPAWDVKKEGDGLRVDGTSNITTPNWKSSNKATGIAGSSVVKLMKGDVKNGSNK
jgi:hypothetical protein